MRNRAIRHSTSDGSLIGLVASYALPLIGGAAVGLSLVYMIVRPQWGDQTWLLYLAQRVLDGAELGFRDISEPNPPLIVWLSMIPVAIGRVLDIRLTEALQGCLAALIAISVIWSAALVRRGPAAHSSQFAGWFALVALFATVVHPWQNFGQREHIMVLLVLPYLMIAAGRLEGQAPPLRQAVIAGLCAGIGFLLKPHFLLVVVAIEMVLLVRSRHIRSLFYLEAMAMIAVGLSYIAAIWLFSPNYLRETLPLALSTYTDYHHATLSEMISATRGLKMLALVLLWAVLYRRLPHRALATVLLLGAIGSTFGALAQLKGHESHFVPAIAFFDMLLGVMAIDCWLLWTARWTQPISTRLAAAGATLTFVAAIALGYPLQVARAAHSYTDDRIAAQQAISAGIPSKSTVLILSTAAESFFEQVLERNWEWGSRFMCLWMLPAIINAEHAADHNKTMEPEAMRKAAVLTRNALSADLERWHPSLVLVDRCQDMSVTPCMGIGTLRVDVLKWLRQDAGFTAAWNDYVHEGQIGPYDLWCRKEEAGVCRRLLTNQGSIAAAQHK